MACSKPFSAGTSVSVPVSGETGCSLRAIIALHWYLSDRKGKCITPTTGRVRSAQRYVRSAIQKVGFAQLDERGDLVHQFLFDGARIFAGFDLPHRLLITD